MEIVTPPAIEPITLEEAKAFLRVTVSDDDTLITGLIKAARVDQENYTGRAFISQTWKENYRRWPDYFDMAKAPLLSVDSIKYLDGTGAEQTLAADQYRVLLDEDAAGRIYRNYGVTWPELYAVPDAITLEFTAGYGPAAIDVPEEIRLALQLSISHFYDNRDGTPAPDAIARALQSYRVYY